MASFMIKDVSTDSDYMDEYRKYIFWVSLPASSYWQVPGAWSVKFNLLKIKKKMDAFVERALKTNIFM